MKSENIGWQCPNCLVVYAPNMQSCKCSVLQTLPLSDGVTINGLYGSVTTNNHTSSTTLLCLGYTSEIHDGVCVKCGKTKLNHPNISYT
jgi:hypothetical protein